MAVFVCSDLHGYPLERFRRFLDRVGFGPSDDLYVLGDVIDRGADGVEILQWLMRTPNAHFLLGNHEQMMLDCDFLLTENAELAAGIRKGAQRMRYSLWMANSGAITLDALSALPEQEIAEILAYLRAAPLYAVLHVGGKKYILTHAGLGKFKKKKALADYTADDLLWERPQITQTYFEDATVIFGHTPTFSYGDIYEGKALFSPTWIDIDVGAGYDLAPLLLRLDDLKLFYDDIA